MKIKKNPQYGRTEFSGVLNSDEEKALSPGDLLILADDGNTCFGGKVSIFGDKFNGRYNID